MNLDRHGREYYKLTITTDPATTPTEWEASFDGGSTWVGATDVDGDASWLVEGPDAPPPVVGKVLAPGPVHPRVRLIEDPEVIVRRPPERFTVT